VVGVELHARLDFDGHAGAGECEDAELDIDFVAISHVECEAQVLGAGGGDANGVWAGERDDFVRRPAGAIGRALGRLARSFP
jgi:hypothetical protein